MQKIVAIANQKGGVGKTTTSVNLATSLALLGQQVLLIDLDPQANATSGLGIVPAELLKSVYDCVVGGGLVQEAVVPTAVAGLNLLPANADLAGAEIELVAVDQRELTLKRALSRGNVGTYDVIIIDCAPALGLLTINALVAASSLLIPVQCEYYAMEGLGRLLATVERVKSSFNPELQIEGILLTMYDSRNSLAKQVVEEVRGHFQSKVYKTVIPRNVSLAEAPSYGRPALLYNASSAGALAYQEVAKEFIANGETSTRSGS